MNLGGDAQFHTGGFPKAVALTALFLFLSHNSAYSQASLYSSLGYGYDQNPLYNYQRQSDHLKTGYVEANLDFGDDPSTVNARYIGGFAMFDRFWQRDFYEHSLTLTYDHHRGKDETDSDSADTTDEDTASAGAGVEAVDSTGRIASQLLTPSTEGRYVASDRTRVDSTAVDDSTDDFIRVQAALGARHDRQVFNQFDNFSGSSSVSYRFGFSGSAFLRATNRFGGRDFTHLGQLSNLVDVLTFEWGRHSVEAVSYGITGSVGAKYYTTAQYDTNQFERTRSFVQKPQGKGKTGAVLVPSQKRIFIQPQNNGTIQVSPGLYAGLRVGGMSVDVSVEYRWNPRSATRYLAETSGASLFSKNVYDDVFSYQGPSAAARLMAQSFLSLQWIATVQYQNEQYGIPALNLVGQIIAGKRTDRHAAVELYASRPFGVFGETTVELFIDLSWISNRSNDEYNNFAYSTFSGGIGIDF